MSDRVRGVPMASGWSAVALIVGAVCCGCGSAQPQPEQPAADVDAAPPVRRPPTLEECRTTTGPFDECHWALEPDPYCGGPPPPPDRYDGPVCRCHQCLEDSDCDAARDGRCLRMGRLGALCGGVAYRVCVHADEPCHPEDNPCPDGQQCLYDDQYDHSCATPVGPPP